MILVTGGAGYIGSHTVVEMLAANIELLILDNFSNSSPKVLDAIERIAGKRPSVIEGDVRDKALLSELFDRQPIDWRHPFRRSQGGRRVGRAPAALLRQQRGRVAGAVRGDGRGRGLRLVFSSSATVYGDPHCVPIREDFPLQATNPYGRTKLIIEDMLRDLAKADPRWRVALLRYFNPVGAHPSGLIGEDPQGIPNNLMPYVSQVAVGRRPELSVFGDDYPTPDGTGVRDYIHVVDLARGHLAALNALDRLAGAVPVNLGTGKGYSVLEVVRAFEKASGQNVPYRIGTAGRAMSPPATPMPALAGELLGWQAAKDLATMCEDAWRWQAGNPSGFAN